MRPYFGVSDFDFRARNKASQKDYRQTEDISPTRIAVLLTFEFETNDQNIATLSRRPGFVQLMRGASLATVLSSVLVLLVVIPG